MLYKIKLNILRIACLVFLYVPNVFPQDFEQVVKSKPVTVTGGINLSGTGYAQSGGNSRRDPFSYQLSANMNFNFFGIVDAPFSAQMTSENKTFNRPSYRQMGFSPSYKWITVHAGWRNMEFSQYTLSGTTFLGAGVELQPETFPLRGKVVYGRFAKKYVQGDTISSYISEPVYNRWGYGAMISAGPLRNSIDLMIFRAEDRHGDKIVFAESVPITPQENLTMGISTRQQIGKHFNIVAQYAISAYTDDTRAEIKKFSTYSYLDNLKPLYTPRYSSRHSAVYDAQVNFQTDMFTVGLGYKRIDPDYQSMGTLFLNNDTEDIQINASTSIMQRKMSLSGSLGLQRDNLDNSQSTENRRIISSFNGNYQISQNLSVSAGYSNYNSSAEPTRVLVQDSIKYVQVSQNFNTGGSYSTGNDTYAHVYNLTYSRQTVNTINSSFTDIERAGTVMNNATAAYRLNYKPVDAGFSLSFNLTHYGQDSIANYNFGPQLSANKGFFDKKVRTSLSYSLQCSQSNASNSSYVNVFRVTASYTYKRSHSFSFNTNMMMRNTQPAGKERSKSRELVATMSYGYRF